MTHIKWRMQKQHSRFRRQGRLRKHLRLSAVLLAVFALSCALFSGCGDDVSAAASVRPASSGIGAKDSSGTESKGSSRPSSAGAYQAPALSMPAFSEEAALGTDKAKIDVSSLSDGYVAARGWSESRLKFQVLCGEETYTYDLPADGTPAFFPLSCGDGSYRFRVMENVVDSKYAEAFSTEAAVVLSSEFAPYLLPSIYVNYSAESECVKKAAELAKTAGTALGEVTAVYEYVCDTVTYDREKAATVKAGYVPVPDETMQSGKGICFDYAALTASMLRSQGIPVKMVFGYVSPDDLYHAWNMFYTAETGWVTVSFEVRPGEWNRLDLTFSANGSDDAFIGDGSNYADVYYY